MLLRFDGKVAVVTGAGGGLGRQYALLLANRGAKVIVNDIGSSIAGQGGSSNFADSVVAQIESQGGIAVADYNSVENGDKIIETALKNFNRIDILINNAGIVRDISFQKMKEEDWSKIMKVHLDGAYSCAKAAWNIMKKQNYGRIINTTSSTGLYGMFGMANYGTAKMALHGFTLTLAVEGQNKNIFVNSIAPYAASRMMKKVVPKQILDIIEIKAVAPFVCYLCHEQCKQNGQLYELGGGLMTKLRWQRSEGSFIDPSKISIQDVQQKMSEISDFDRKSEYPTKADEFFSNIMQHRQSSKPKL